MNTSIYPAYSVQAWSPLYQQWLNVTNPDNQPHCYAENVLPAYQRLVANAKPGERYRTVKTITGYPILVDGPSGAAI